MRFLEPKDCDHAGKIGPILALLSWAIVAFTHCEVMG